MIRRVDLRSDTVTKPCAGMREAMFKAEVGDDVYRDDPTVRRFEERVAEVLGKEASLFVPSGTMANQIAINLHTKAGDSILCEDDAHIFKFEAGAAAALSGVQPQYVKAGEWQNPDIVAKRLLSADIHQATTTLLAIENTHNMSGGRVFAPDLLAQITNQAKAQGLATHCDGARIWNAAVALGRTPKELAMGFDSVAVCFSKGLGAPVGSAICGSAKFIEQARRVRKRFGGAMRQSGILAAAALYALENNFEKLADDHRRIEDLRWAVSSLSQYGCEVETKFPELATNMLYFRLPVVKTEVVAEGFSKAGILINHSEDGWFRAVTHLQISDDDIAYFTETITSLAQSFPRL